LCFFFFSSRRRHTRLVSDWSSDVCSSDLACRHQFSQQPKALWPQILGKIVYAGNVARGSIKAIDETKLYWIGADAEDDGNRAGRSLGRERCCRAARCGDDGHLALHKLGHQCRHAIELILPPTIFDYNIAAIDETGSLRPSRNAAARWARASEVPSWRKPTTGIAACCARAARGHDAAPPSNVMNSRRFIRSPRRRARAACREFGGRAPSRS